MMCALLILVASLLAAGCARPVEPPRSASTNPPPAAAYELGGPVVNPQQAELAGRQLFERPGQSWLGHPKLVLAEEMEYQQAVRRIGVGEGQYDLWPEHTRVWLTVFQGRWQLMPMLPPGTLAAPNTFEGCVLVVFAAADGGFISMGDAVCPLP
jgi:hypothetical protein